MGKMLRAILRSLLLSLPLFSLIVGVTLFPAPKVDNASAAIAINSDGLIFEKLTSQDELEVNDLFLLVGYDGDSRMAISGIDNNGVVLTSDISHYCDDSQIIMSRSDIEVFCVGTKSSRSLCYTISFTGGGSFAAKYAKADTDNGVLIAENGANGNYDWDVGPGAQGENMVFTCGGYNLRTGTYNGNSTIVAAEDASSNIRIYRKINKSISAFSINAGPTKTNYYVGDSFDPAGLCIYATINNAGVNEYSYIPYDDKFFDFSPSVFTSTDTTSITVTYGGRSASWNGITVEQSDCNGFERDYYVDYRGTYLITKHHDWTPMVVFNGKTGANVTGYSETNGVIAYDEALEEDYSIKIERNTIGGNSYYHIRNANDKYLYLDEDGIHFQDTATSSNAATISVTERNGYTHWASIGTAAGGTMYYLRFVQPSSDSGYFDTTYSGSSHCITLYRRLSKSRVAEEIATFNTLFHNTIQDDCDPTGASNNISSSEWETVSNAFLALSLDAQSLIASNSYTQGTDYSGVTSTEATCSLYDYIVSKYGYDEFMDRRACGSFISSSEAQNSLPMYLDSNSDYFLPILISLGVITLPLTIFILFRKRKEA